MRQSTSWHFQVLSSKGRPRKRSKQFFISSYWPNTKTKHSSKASHSASIAKCKTSLTLPRKIRIWSIRDWATEAPSHNGLTNKWVRPTDPAAPMEDHDLMRTLLQDQIPMEPLMSSIAINFWKIAERKSPWALSTTLPSWMAPMHSHREMGRSWTITRRCQWKVQPTFRQLITLRPSRQTFHLINMFLKAPSTSH